MSLLREAHALVGRRELPPRSKSDKERPWGAGNPRWGRASETEEHLRVACPSTGILPCFRHAQAVSQGYNCTLGDPSSDGLEQV